MTKEVVSDIRWDHLYFNGVIHTLDETMPDATWMLIHKGRIAKLGNNPPSDIPVQQKLDLKGKTVVPGFIDSHTHLFSYGIAQKFWVNLGNTKTRQEAAEEIRKKASKLPTGEWVVAYYWDESQWKDPILLDLEILDNACPNHPVYAIRVCGHLVAVNSRALELLTEQLNDLSKDEKTEASQGILRDIELDRKQFYPPPSKILEGIETGCLKAARLGITTAHDMVSEELLRYYFKAEKEGKLRIRICANIPTAVLPAVEKIGIISIYGSDKLKIGGLKLFYDGSIGARTALVTEEFADMPGETGLIFTPPEEFTDYLNRAIEAKIQPVVHAIGDKAINNVLKEYSLHQDKIAELRPRMEHVEMANDFHMEKAAEMNIIFSMQPNFNRWALPGGLYETRLGKTRVQQMNAFSRALSKNVRVAFGSDGMPLGPLLGLHFAVNHPIKESSLTVEQAIRSYTIEGAYCEFQEDEKGTLSEGKLADFVVLSGDPWENPEEIKEMAIEVTVVGGEIIYRSATTTISPGD
ncbi:MAG: amidohydrolase [Candidatus Thorarchaeota archaeon]